MLSTPTLATLAARRANRTPFSQFQTLTRPAQEAIYEEACTPDIVWNIEVVDDEPEFEYLAVTLFYYIRDNEIIRCKTDVAEVHLAQWYRLRGLLDNGIDFQENIRDLNIEYSAEMDHAVISITSARNDSSMEMVVPPISIFNFASEILDTFGEVILNRPDN